MNILPLLIFGVMGDFDFNAPLVGLIIKLVSTVGIVYVTLIQLEENRRPRDGATGLRRILTILLFIIVFSSIPSLAYNSIRAIGLESPILRDITTIATNMSYLAISVLLVLIYNYKDRDRDNKSLK